MPNTETLPRSVALVALGANLGHDGAQPAAVLERALAELGAAGLTIISRSRFWRTPAWPPGSGPDFVNACAILDPVGRDARGVLAILHDVEATLGRERRTRWAPRTCDLDLLAMGDAVLPDCDTVARWMALDPAEQTARAPDGLVLPHPRLQERAFVLVPLAEIAPDWCHPVTGLSVAAMLGALPAAARDEPVALE